MTDIYLTEYEKEFILRQCQAAKNGRFGEVVFKWQDGKLVDFVISNRMERGILASFLNGKERLIESTNSSC